MYLRKHEMLKCNHCDAMRSNSFSFVLAPLRRYLCLIRLETHTKGLRTRSPARPEAEEGRNVPEKTERASWQSRAEEDSRLEIAVKGKDGQQKEAVRENSQLASLEAL